MDLALLIPAFLLGMAGSLHCVGMCGPLALALPLGESSLGRLGGSILYNAGRMVTYTMYGFVFGGLGKQFVLFGGQQWFSIILGVLLLLIVLYPWRKTGNSGFNKLIFNWSGRIRHLAARLMKNPHPLSVLGFGILNGMLPCGLVYMGLAGAAATGEFAKGGLFMLAFGAGTFPSLWSVAFFGTLIRTPVRERIRRIYPFIIAIMGLILILRGLNLGIPYLSPQLNTTALSAIHCNGR